LGKIEAKLGQKSLDLGKIKFCILKSIRSLHIYHDKGDWEWTLGVGVFESSSHLVV